MMTKFELFADTKNEEYHYYITIEEGPPNLIRMNVTCTSEENEAEFNNSQGIDLTKNECKVLGKYLLEVASININDE